MNPPKLFPFILLLIAISLVGGNRLRAQETDENNFIRYSKQQGLSHNIVTGVVQDSTGYIWIATAYGLNRFDGSNFVQFHSSNDSLSLPAEQITGLVWLDRYNLAACANGLHIINTRTGETHNLFIPYSNKQFQYKFNWIVSVSSNTAGDIFLLTKSGFYQYDSNYNLVFRFDYYPDQEVPSSSFDFGKNLLWLDKQNLAIVTNNGMYYYNVPGKRFRKMVYADCPILGKFLDYPKMEYAFFQQKCGSFFVLKPESDSLVYCNVEENRKTAIRLPVNKDNNEFGYRSEMGTLDDSTLYITGNVSGFYKLKFSPKTGKIQFIPKKYFPFYRCQHLLQDRDQNLWIASNKGLFRQNISRSYVQQGSIPESLEGQFPNIVIDDICVVGNKLYAGTRGNGGLLEFDAQQLKFIRRISVEKAGTNAENILSITAADDSSLLLGTEGPLYRLDLKTGKANEMAFRDGNLAPQKVTEMFKDRKKNIWITADNIYRYDVINQVSTNISDSQAMLHKIEKANLIREDASGNIWIAGHGILRYNVVSNSIDRQINSFPYIKMPDRQVNTLATDQHNNLWLNSNNNGLTCYNIDKGSFRHFTRGNGLPDNNIAAMIVIGNKLWMACYSGISCLDLRTFKFTSFGTEDGFPDLPITNDAKFYYNAPTNKLYIGFTNTIVQFNPDIIFQKAQAPHLFVESVTTCDQKRMLFPGQNISTSWKHNGITVSIGSINFITSNSQRFAYRLINEDNGWQQLGAQNNFSISNLSPGYHRIQVKLYSINNRWPEQVREIDITILPPFWKLPWFMAIYVILLLVSVYLLLRWRTGLIRKKERAKTHIQTLKAEEYKYQFELEQISNYFSSSLADKKNVEDVLWDVATNLIGRMNYVDCMIYLWNEDQTKMVQKASYGPKGSPKAIAEKVFDVAPGQGIVGHVMQTKEPLLIPDTSKDHRYRMDDIKRQCEICVPIIHNDELIGILDSEHHSQDYFKERDLKILTTIATLLGNKIKQIESEQSLEIKQREISTINQKLAEAQLSAFQTQMNPHFIFNSLNSIKGMILANEQQKASRYLSKFAQMIRITLNQSKAIFTTLHENLEYLESYLAMEKLRFDDSFTYRIIVDNDIDKEETLIPTLMIQPLAENAIWHGLMHKKGDKKLLIHFSRLEDTIACSIEDNGIGINRSEQLKQFNRPIHHSVGLSNLRNRIKILNEKYNASCTLEITDQKECNKYKTGTCAVLRFNIITNSPFL